MRYWNDTLKRAIANPWVRGIAAACVVLLYLPPIGQTIALPDIEPFLEPGVPHATPTFIHTEHHVYYRVRLHRPVEPWFAWTYYQRLHARGVQIEQLGASAYRPVLSRSSWHIGMVREKALDPYTIEYWKSQDRESGWFPISLRWPWLYVRLGPQVALPPLTAVLTPPAMPLRLSPVVPQFPGARLIAAEQDHQRIVLRFWAPATRADIHAHYIRVLKHSTAESESNSNDYNISSTTFHALAALRARSILVDISNYLYSDYPVVVYPTDQGPGSFNHRQQPALLGRLPLSNRFGIFMFFVSQDAAVQAWKQIVTRDGED